MEKLDADARNIYLNHLQQVRPMNDLTAEESRTFETALQCYICKKTFVDGDVKVRDHCHLTDSCRFMQRFLDELASNLSDEQCGEVRKRFGEEEKFLQMRRKGVFPYS
ncbi:hypothetical protein ILUMI_20336, partial [Ignelater luminosus]